MEGHAFLKLEHQRLKILELPALRQTRLELERERLEINQGVEHAVEHVEIREVAPRHRVDRTGIVGHGDAQCAAFARRVLGEARPWQQQCAGGCGGRLHDSAPVQLQPINVVAHFQILPDGFIALI